jgi:DNA-directed RNA polymerase subunit RPC12/RpoP
LDFGYPKNDKNKRLNMPEIDVTGKVEYGLNDDECLPLLKCVCGKEFKSWDFVLPVYSDDPAECPDCGAKLFFQLSIKVFQIKD